MMSNVSKAVADFRRLPLRVFLAKLTRRCSRVTREATSRLQGKLGTLALREARLERHLAAQGITRAAWPAVFAEQLKRVSLLNFDVSRSAVGLDDRFRDTIDAGQKARAHVFDLLGSGPVKVNAPVAANGRGGHRYSMPPPAHVTESRLATLRTRLPSGMAYEPIDWHVDFISGYRWAADLWHSEMKVGPAPGVDIRVPWELGRCYHLVTLAKCWALSRDAAYTEEIVAQITDFISANPVGFGPNWVCPMDIAIRVSNWLVALCAVAHAGGIDESRAMFIATAIHDHARFIETNLEWSAEVNGNHYTADLVGLYFVGVHCPHLPKAARWRRFAERELEQEIEKQVYEDGCNFEGSTLYHRLVLELFMYAWLLGKRDGREFSARYRSKIAAMCNALRQLSFGNGEIAQIGDNDSARFVTVDSLPLASLRVDHYLPVGDWLFGRSGAGYPDDVDMSHLWWLGGSPSASPVLEWGARRSALFPDAGWAVLRRGAWECLVSCGPNGQNGNGGHGHNDKLGLSLMFGPAHLFVDPGSYLYSADRSARNLYRSTAFHSTPQLGDKEQNPFPELLFSLPDNSDATILSFDEHAFSGSHRAYGEAVRLDVSLRDDEVLFEYEVGPGEFTMRWLLHPTVKVEAAGSFIQLVAGSQEFRFWQSGSEVNITEYRFSPAYGRAVPALMLTSKFRTRLECRVILVS